MKSRILKRLVLANSRGSVLVLVTLLLVVFIGIAALAIDVGLLYASKNELQNAADSAALGATRKLGNIYQGITNLTGYTVNNANGDKDTIISVAKVVAFQNKVVREGITIDETQGDIQIGVWNPDSVPKFTETDDLPNAVKVTAHRDDDNTSGQIATFFTGIFGIDSVPVSAVATAALLGQGTSEPGELEIPVGLSERWFYRDGEKRDDFCGDEIRFHPTPKAGEETVDACAGWTSMNLKMKNENLESATQTTMNKILDGGAPAATVGDEFAFTNGDNVSSVFKNLLRVYGENGFDVDRIYDPDQPLPIEVTNGTPRIPLCTYDGVITECAPADVIPPGTPYDNKDLRAHERYPSTSDAGNADKFSGELRYAHEWETTVPVYSASDLTGVDSCTPGKPETLKGFVKVVLYNIGGPSDASIYGRVSCDVASPEATRSGGAYFGLLGTIPGLVE